MNDITLINIF